MTPQLRELAKLQEMATPGPWRFYRDYSRNPILETVKTVQDFYKNGKPKGRPHSIPLFAGIVVIQDDDAAFIAAAGSISWPAVVAKWERLHADNERMRKALVEAREMVQEWGAYASDYFKEKHGFAEDLAKLDATLEAKP